jgi:5-methylcytosine-specific restriction endonuclease McrA
MKDIAHKALCLKLNANWKPVGIGLVGPTICDLMTGVIEALDISYSENPDGSINFDDYNPRPCTWEEWVMLPLRPWDWSIHSTHMTVRVPTVVVAKNYSKVPHKKFMGKPTKEGLAIRDNLIDAYTGEELEYDRSTIDHVIPLFRGGTNTYHNTVLTTKETNNRKGHKLNSEAGLTLFVTPHHPKSIPVSQTIRKARHTDWRHFLETPKK